jgi:hypothetical protein
MAAVMEDVSPSMEEAGRAREQAVEKGHKEYRGCKGCICLESDAGSVSGSQGHSSLTDEAANATAAAKDQTVKYAVETKDVAAVIQM